MVDLFSKYEYGVDLNPDPYPTLENDWIRIRPFSKNEYRLRFSPGFGLVATFIFRLFFELQKKFFFS